MQAWLLKGSSNLFPFHQSIDLQGTIFKSLKMVLKKAAYLIANVFVRTSHSLDSFRSVKVIKIHTSTIYIYFFLP